MKAQSEQKTLQAFCEFLEANGYLDSDWRDESPTAIDRFASQFKSQSSPIEQKTDYKTERQRFIDDYANNRERENMRDSLGRIFDMWIIPLACRIKELESQPLPIEGGKSLYDTINEALRDFRLSYIFDENREGLHLSDRLSPDEDTTVTLGLQEIEYLTEHIVEAIKDLPIEGVEREWISVKDRPLFTKDEKGRWTATDDGDKEFIAALRYHENGKGEQWWIRHCVIEDFDGLCVVGDDCNEPAGWHLEDVEFWMPLPAPPKNG